MEGTDERVTDTLSGFQRDFFVGNTNLYLTYSMNNISTLNFKIETDNETTPNWPTTDCIFIL